MAATSFTQNQDINAIFIAESPIEIRRNVTISIGLNARLISRRLETAKIGTSIRLYSP